jgi:hypothetical protein
MFEVRVTRSRTAHITGLNEATKASRDGMDYALSACPSISRPDFVLRTEVVGKFETLPEATSKAAHYRTCKNCLKAAARVAAQSTEN